MLAERLRERDSTLAQEARASRDEKQDFWFKKLSKWLERCTPREPGKATFDGQFPWDLQFGELATRFAAQGVTMTHWHGNQRYGPSLCFEWK